MVSNASKPTGKINAYVSKYKNPSSAAGYKSAIESFLRCMFDCDKVDADGHKKVYNYEKMFDDYLKKYAERMQVIDETLGLKNKNDLLEAYEESLNLDFVKFSECLVKTCKSKQSARQIMTYCKTMLKEYKVVVPDCAMMHLKREMKGGKAQATKSISPEMICRIVGGADVRGKAIVLMLSSSGLRINELLALKLEQKTDDDSYIDMTHNPIQIFVSAKDAKNKLPRFTFISNEAKKALLAWLDARNEYISVSSKYSERLKKSGNIEAVPDYTTTRYIFPYSDNAITSMWNTLVSRAGFYTPDKENKISNPYTIHEGLRGFFLSTMAYAGFKSLGEYLGGHSGYLDNSYRQSPFAAEADYKKAESKLRCCIESDIAEEMNTQKAEIYSLTETTHEQKESIVEVRELNRALRQQMKQQENDVVTLKDILKAQQKMLDDIMSKLNAHEVPGTQYVDAELGNIPEGDA